MSVCMCTLWFARSPFAHNGMQKLVNMSIPVAPWDEVTGTKPIRSEGAFLTKELYFMLIRLSR